MSSSTLSQVDKAVSALSRHRAYKNKSIDQQIVLKYAAETLSEDPESKPDMPWLQKHWGWQVQDNVRRVLELSIPNPNVEDQHINPTIDFTLLEVSVGDDTWDLWWDGGDCWPHSITTKQEAFTLFRLLKIPSLL
jgi:hypothetical protein